MSDQPLPDLSLPALYAKLFEFAAMLAIDIGLSPSQLSNSLMIAELQADSLRRTIIHDRENQGEVWQHALGWVPIPTLLPIAYEALGLAWACKTAQGKDFYISLARYCLAIAGVAEL